jgi:hypothetical protein
MKKTILLLAALPAIGLLVAFTKHTTAVRSIPEHQPGDAFKEFLAQFKPATLPYSISAKKLQDQMASALKETNSKRSKKIGRLQDPEGFIPFDHMSMISRVPTYREPEVQLATADHHVVVYSISRGFSRPYKTYMAVVFDKKGTALAGHRIAEISHDFLTAATIDANLQATVQTYRINWKEEALENPDTGSPIAGLTPETSKVLDLTQPAEDEESPRSKLPIKKLETPVGKSIGTR